MKLRDDLPFRRIAVVLAGGGTYGAYEAGALRTLSAAGLRPAIVAGVSVGALNAVAWLSHAGDTANLERTWRGLRPERLGIRWTMLAMRAGGGFMVALGLLESLLLVAGLPESSVLERFAALRELGGYLRTTGLIEFVSWVLLAAAGLSLVALAPRIDDALARLASRPTSPRGGDRLGVAVLAGAALYGLVLALGLPWPLRFHLVAWTLALLWWVVLHVAPLRLRLGRLWLKLTPETGGRGLWRNGARRQLIDALVAEGNPARLVDGPVQLFVSACDVSTGIVTYFTNRAPGDGALGRVFEPPLSNLVVLATPGEMLDAAVASSAVPVLYEPFAYRGRRFVDAGLFANQPLRTVVAAGADAVLLVLVSPSTGPRPVDSGTHLVEIAGRLSEIATWRDLQTELQQLPEGFAREGSPATVCVVEPQGALEGGMFEFEPNRAGRLIERGAADAAAALRRAGWLAPDALVPDAGA